MSNLTGNFFLHKKYFSVILVLALFFSPQVSRAIESRKIEKLIEGALSPIEKQNRIKENMFKKLIKNYKNSTEYISKNTNTLDIIF